MVAGSLFSEQKSTFMSKIRFSPIITGGLSLVLSCLAPSLCLAGDGSILTLVPAFIVKPAYPTWGDQLVVSPSGSGTACTSSTPCSLTTARDRIRARNSRGGLSSDVTVLLKKGTYALSSTFSLTAADSGTNGYTVTYASAVGGRAVLDGGVTIGGWVLHDGNRGIYRASVPSWLTIRQLHVNGRRAQRARGLDNASFVRTDYGFTCRGSCLAGLADLTGVELVGFNEWRSFRCRVAGTSGDAIYMQDPCWNNAVGNGQPDDGFDSVAWVENDYTLLDTAGEWYLDQGGDQLYYLPRADENLATARVVAPRVQTPVSATGSAAAPVHDIDFINLDFAHANWTAPSTADGYADLQAGFHYRGSNMTLTRTPAAVNVVGGRNLGFYGNRFSALGGAGLSVHRASSAVTISGNRFEDIASSAIQLGDIDDAGASGNNRNYGYRVTDNVIIEAGALYHDGVGIFAGYLRDSHISNNELFDLPYSGISLGWGWGVQSYASGNRISGNLVENVMQTLEDGAAIYTLGPQPGSSIDNNYLCMQSGTNGGIYPDQGSSGFSIHHNVLSHVGHSWLFLWTANVNANHAWHNFTDNVSMIDDGTANVVEDTILVQGGNWPAEASAIMAVAGLSSGGSGRSSFCSLRPTALLVEDDTEVAESGGRWALAKAMYDSGVPFANWDTQGGYDEPTVSQLASFSTVVWDAGQGEFWEAGPASSGALSSWLDLGGRKLLLVSKAYHQSPLPDSLARNYLGLNTPSPSLFTLASIRATGWLGTATYPLKRNLETSPVSGGSDSTVIVQASGQRLGQSRTVNGSKAIYFGVPFDLVADDTDRAVLMQRMLAW
jgi:hypothetical protein